MKIFSCKFTAGLVLTCFLCLTPVSAAPAEAADDVPKTGPGPPTADKINITAQRLVSNTADNLAEFSGNVQARQGETLISADNLKIYFSGDSKADKASPAQSLEKLVATGNVEIKFDNRLAVAQQAVYITAQRVLILSGPGATVTSGDNTITGQTITFFRDDGRFTVEGGSNGRVKAVILPEASGLE